MWAVLASVAVLAAVNVPLAAGGAATVRSAAWRVRTVPAPMTPNGRLLGVSCATSTQCVTVGVYNTSTASTRPLVERWDGTAWTVLSAAVPPSATTSEFTSVSCPLATFCIAGGSYSTSSGVTYPLAERWTGAAWTITTTYRPAGTSYDPLVAVSCSSSTACTAVGATSSNGSNTSFAERFNGTSWSLQSTATLPGLPSNSLTAVSCPTSAVCLAVGNASSSAGVQSTLVELWNGGAWHAQATPSITGSTSATLQAVWCASATSCVAVGGASMSSGAENTLAETLSGTTWSVTASPDPVPGGTNELDGVTCTAVTWCEAVGQDRNLTTGQGAAVVEDLRGTSWATQSPVASGQISQFTGVSCPTTTSCVAGGFSATTATVTALAESGDGTSWDLTPVVSPTGVKSSDLNDVSCSSATACTAVGAAHSDVGPPLPLAERWNGKTWSIETAPSPSSAFNSLFNAVSCPSATRCVAVGLAFDWTTTEQLLETWNGSAWTITPLTSPPGATSTELTSVSCPSTTVCVAVGDYDTSAGSRAMVQRLSNGSWTSFTPGPPPGTMATQFNAVSCPTTTSCVAAGTETTNSGDTLALAEKMSGSVWSVTSTVNPSSSGTQLIGVSCRTSTMCVAVGTASSSISFGAPVAEKWNGVKWTLFSLPDHPAGALGGFLYGVACTSTTSCMVVGQSPDAVGSMTLAEHWNGRAWTILATKNPGTQATFNTGVSCPSAKVCVAVGSTSSGGPNVPLVEQYS